MKENRFKLKIARSRLYLTETITDANNADDLALPANKSTGVESLLQSLEQTARDIGLFMNSNKIDFIHIKQDTTAQNLIANL